MNKEERYNLIERYIRKEMEPQELNQFREALSIDVSLQRELQLHAELHDAIQTDSDAFRQLLKTAETDYFSSGKSEVKSRSLATRYLIAAAVTFLITAFIGFYYVNKKQDTHEIFIAYFAPYEVPGTFRSENSIPLNQDAEKALTLYKDKKYNQAISSFAKVLEVQPNNTIYAFLRGVCYLATDRPEEAEADFKRVIADGNNLFVEQAKWYLCLSYIRQDDMEKACALLQTTTPPHAFSEAVDICR